MFALLTISVLIWKLSESDYIRPSENQLLPEDLTVTLREGEAFLLSKDTYVHPPTPRSPKLPLGRPETTIPCQQKIQVSVLVPKGQFHDPADELEQRHG